MQKKVTRGSLKKDSKLYISKQTEIENAEKLKMIKKIKKITYKMVKKIKICIL